MKRQIQKTIISAVLFVISIVLSWGGMIYAANDPNQFRPIGILAALIGYGFVFGAICIYEAAHKE